MHDDGFRSRGRMSVRATVSFWMDDAARRGLVPDAAGPLDRPLDIDALVIGGGFAGLSCAIELARATPARRVALLEAHRVGFGASGRNAGMLVPLAAPAWLVDGALPAHLAQEALLELRRRTDAAVAELAAVDGGPEPATMVFTAPHRLAEQAIGWLHGRLERLGIATVPLDRAEAAERIGEPCRAALGLASHCIHPARLVLALRGLAVAAGVSLFEHTRVARFAGRAGGIDAWTDDGIPIRARRVILATGAWTPSFPVRADGTVTQTWMVASEPLDADALQRLGSDGIVVGLRPGFPYRRTFDGRLLFGGLDDRVPRPHHAGSVPDNVVPRLRRLLATSLPWLGDVELACAWGGPVHATFHEMPRLRTLHDVPGLIVVDGLSGSGVLWGLLAGRLARGLVDPELDDPGARLLRGALAATRVPWTGALGVGLRIAAKVLVGAVRPAGPS